MEPSSGLDRGGDRGGLGLHRGGVDEVAGIVGQDRGPLGEELVGQAAVEQRGLQLAPGLLDQPGGPASLAHGRHRGHGFRAQRPHLTAVAAEAPRRLARHHPSRAGVVGQERSRSHELSLALEFNNLLDGVRKSGAFICRKTRGAVSDTDFLAGFASDDFALPLLYNEILPRGLEWGEDVETAFLARLAPRLVAFRLPEGAGPITIDGTLDEAIWKSSSLNPGFDRTSRGDKNRLWCLYDSRGLYVSARMSLPEADPEIEKLLEDRLQHDVVVVNDADAAGVAELAYGAAKGQDGLVIIGVNQQEQRAAAAEFVDEFGVTYTVALDASGEVSAAYGVGRGMPISFLVSPGGVIEQVYFGRLTETQFAELEARLP